MMSPADAISGNNRRLIRSRIPHTWPLYLRVCPRRSLPVPAARRPRRAW
jgi:hypothetical protein